MPLQDDTRLPEDHADLDHSPGQGMRLMRSMPLQDDTRLPEDHADLDHSPGQGMRLMRSTNKMRCVKNPVQCLPVKMQDLIDQPNPNRDHKAFSISSGAGVHIFLLDTGVRDTHQEFTGRASFYFDVIRNQNGENVTGDGVGHGTRAASVAMGQNIGIARGATLKSIRVSQLNERGSITAAHGDVIEGLDKVLSWANANPDEKCVVLHSLAGPFDSALNEKFSNIAKNTDCVVVVPAGNVDDNTIQSYNACDFSPGSISDVIRVGATNNGSLYSRSTYGQCVDIYAPGRRINVAKHTDDTGYARTSGTSYAAAAVAGAAAVILGNNDVQRQPGKTMTEIVKDILIETSSKNRILNLPPNSFNRFLNVQNTTIYGSV